VGAAISNDCGPNSYIVLESSGIPIYLSGTCKTARAAVEQFKAGKLATIYTPTSAAPEPAVAS
jgi:predicted Fe-Mo cluster-binding NifX family protein